MGGRADARTESTATQRPVEGEMAVVLALAGKQTIAWSAPPKCPSGLVPASVTIGPDEAGMGLEVAQAEWSGSGAPSREAMASLHTARLAKRLCPVVVVAAGGAHVWLFGPNAQGQLVGPVPRDQVERLLQAGLDQPSGLLGRQRLTALYEALEGTALPGVANAGLFATNDLRKGVRQRPDWPGATEAAKPLLALRREQLIKALGYATERSGGHALVLATASPHPRAVAVLLEDTEGFDAESARFAVSPIAYGLAVAAKQGIPWLIVARGSQLRLYPARPDVGVGRKGQAETYFELDLALLTDDTAGFLPLVFAGSALDEGGTAEQLLGSSAQYAVGLGERLRTKVYEDIVPSLSLAIAAQLPSLGHPLDRAGLDLAYQLTLRTFFRLLFQAYAEDRKLLPYGENPRYDRNALNTVAKDLTENPDQPLDPESTSLWDDLAQVWKVIDKGDTAWSVPPYNGGLFSTDPDLHPEGALLANISVTNDVLGPALNALLIDADDDGTTGPIDFRSLSVREFGTIYEGLLESNLALADVDLTLGKDDTWLPAGRGDEVVAPAGSVYFHNTSGQRKGTGSYFTPSFVVEHLLERALDPALDAHLARIAELLDRDDTAGAARDFFDFRVADLAMGSAHFLTAAIDHIESKMAAFLADHDIPGVTQELRHLEEAARNAAGPDAPDPEPSSLLRRQVARRCIYGLDINPVAVELARVSIWIHTFVRGLPMSSLDHNLVCANSLTGIGSVDEALDVLVEGRKGNQLTVFDAPIEEALDKARDVLADVAAAAEATRPEAEAAARAAQRARAEAETARLLFDAAVLKRIGRDGLVAATEPDKIAALAAQPAAQDAVAALNPAHFPYLFPEVFLRERPGFDVLIGNPPWDKVRHEPVQFWVQKVPGLQTARDREAAIAVLRASQPIHAAEEDAEIEARELLKQAVSTHFALQGSGHHELSKYFAERNLQLVSPPGSVGLVLPGAFCSLGGWSGLRAAFLGRGLTSITQSENRAGFLFPSVDHRISVTTVASVGDSLSTMPSGEALKVLPGCDSREALRSENWVDIDELIDRDGDAQIPWLGSVQSASVFAKLSRSPALSSGEGWITGQPDTRWDFSGSGRHRDFASTEPAASSWRVLMTRHVLQYSLSDTGIRKFVSPEKLKELVLNGDLDQGGGSTESSTLPPGHPRIVYRFPSRATDTRTLIAALLPTSGWFYSTGYAHGVRTDRSEHELALLAVMNSVPSDWWARKLVDRHVGARIIRRLPIPRLSPAELDQVEAVARRCVDSAAEGGRLDLEDLAQIDALVSHGHGLDRDDVIHVFETFHRGWDYGPRLEKVLGYFDAIGRG